MNLLCCTGCCSPFVALGPAELAAVDKCLGNINSSHKSITFSGLINVASNKAMMLHYLINPTFLQSQEKAKAGGNGQGLPMEGGDDLDGMANAGLGEP